MRLCLNIELELIQGGGRELTLPQAHGEPAAAGTPCPREGWDVCWHRAGGTWSCSRKVLLLPLPAVRGWLDGGVWRWKGLAGEDCCSRPFMEGAWGWAGGIQLSCSKSPYSPPSHEIRSLPGWVLLLSAVLSLAPEFCSSPELACHVYGMWK